MPNWQPNWKDVRWNYMQASAIAATLRRAAGQLDTTRNSRVSAAAQAIAAWLGGKRTSFDSSLVVSNGQDDDQSQALRELAARIERASTEARAEQSRRERDRQRWHDEKADEDRQRAQREQQQPQPV